MAFRLIPHWKQAWKMWSVRLGLVASTVVTYLGFFPDTLLTVMNSLPPEMRAVFPPATGFIVLGVVTASRLLQQKNIRRDQQPK